MRTAQMSFTFLTFLTTSRDAKARTILGWTPGLRTLVGGRVLPCGCLTGIYNTWTGDVVAIVDAPSDACPHAHCEHAILWRNRTSEQEPGTGDLELGTARF